MRPAAACVMGSVVQVRARAYIENIDFDQEDAHER